MRGADDEGGLSDGHGGEWQARGEITMIKVVVPRMALRVLDRSIQAHGAAGVCDDFPMKIWAHRGRSAWLTAPTKCTGRPLLLELTKGR